MPAFAGAQAGTPCATDQLLVAFSSKSICVAIKELLLGLNGLDQRGGYGQAAYSVRRRNVEGTTFYENSTPVPAPPGRRAVQYLHRGGGDPIRVLRICR
jgi:hypothetical protein